MKITGEPDAPRPGGQNHEGAFEPGLAGAGEATATLPRKSVRGVDRVLAIFEAIASGEFGLSEIAREASLSPSTTHRLVSALLAHEYVVQDAATQRYVLGYKFVELAEGVRQRGAYLELAARDQMEAVAEQVGESASLAALDHDRPVYIAQAHANRTLRHLTVVGKGVPLHSTAVGKALLAEMPPAARAQLLPAGPYARITPSTILEPSRLLADLKRTQTRGFAVEREENEEGLVSVAAPIFRAGREVVGALCISAPAGRVRGDTVAVWGDTVRSYADKVSARLGA